MPLVHGLSIFASLLILVEQVWNSSIIHVDGTSASTPTAASIFALANDARIAKGKKRLGFLNPTLYSSKISSTFTDIIIGNAAGCGVVGFQATDGWDAATGLGTPVSCKFAHYVEHAGSTNIMSVSGISTTCRCFTPSIYCFADHLAEFPKASGRYGRGTMRISLRNRTVINDLLEGLLFGEEMEEIHHVYGMGSSIELCNFGVE
jgi:hypothetical protein